MLNYHDSTIEYTINRLTLSCKILIISRGLDVGNYVRDSRILRASGRHRDTQGSLLILGNRNGSLPGMKSWVGWKKLKANTHCTQANETLSVVGRGVVC